MCPICPVFQVRIELYDRKQTKFISAHNTPLVCLTLSMDGKRLATASDKGTLVRVWNTADGQLLQVRQSDIAAANKTTEISLHAVKSCCNADAAAPCRSSVSAMQQACDD